MKSLLEIVMVALILAGGLGFLGGYMTGKSDCKSDAMSQYNDKIASWVVPYDQTKHKAPGYGLMGKDNG